MKNKKYTKKAFVFLRLFGFIRPVKVRLVRITEDLNTRITEDNLVRVLERSL